MDNESKPKKMPGGNRAAAMMAPKEKIPKGTFKRVLGYIMKDYKLEDIKIATKQIHFPESFEEFEKARYRLVFEELLSMQLALISLKNKYTKEEKGIAFSKKVKMSDVINILPFNLTKAQLRVLEEIDTDMEKEKAMNRLLQGDVGSRKNYNCTNCGI